MAEKRHDWFLNQVFQHRAALHRYLGKLTSGAEDIEDLVQETYVRIYALPDYPPGGIAQGLAVPDRPQPGRRARPAPEDPGHRHNGGFRVLERLFYMRRRRMSRPTRAVASSRSAPPWSGYRPCAGGSSCSARCTSSRMPRFRRCSASPRARSRSTWPRAWCAVGTICGSWVCWMLSRRKLARGHCAASQTAGAVNERSR